MADDPGRAARLTDIPELLRKLPRWMFWRLKVGESGQPTKKPVGSILDPKMPKPWSEVENTKLLSSCPPRIPSGGLGFLLTGGVRLPSGALLVALDIDACRDPNTGTVSPWALDVIRAFRNSYTEITPSGTGLRLWLRVQDPPNSLPVIRPPVDAPPGVTKRPEIQTFGLGPAGYVTVTGERLEGTKTEVVLVKDLSYLMETFDVTEGERAEDVELPEGDGEPPSLEEIEKRLTGRKDVQMLAGEWEALGFPSASECAWETLGAVLRAAGNHGEPAIEFMLLKTPWGSGLIDSRDPGKYQRKRWWRRELGRLVSKRGHEFGRAPGEVFTELPVEDEAVTRLRVVPVPKWVASKPIAFPWLYRGLLPARGVLELFGQPGAGKSAVALSMAIHAGLGLDWLGHAIKKPSWWLYVVAEGAAGMANRVRATAKGLGVSYEDMRGYVYDGSLAMMEEKHVQALHDTVEALCDKHGEPPAVLTLDTLAANFGAGDENSTEDASLVAARMQRLARLDTLMSYVHHMGHDQRKKRGRGNSALLGNADATIMVQMLDDRLVRITPMKAKDWQRPEAKTRALQTVELGPDQDGDPITSIWLDANTDVESPFGDPVLDYLMSNPHASVRDLATGLGISKSAAHRKIAALQKAGDLIGDGGKASPWVVQVTRKNGDIDELLS